MTNPIIRGTTLRRTAAALGIALAAITLSTTAQADRGDRGHRGKGSAVYGSHDSQGYRQRGRTHRSAKREIRRHRNKHARYRWRHARRHGHYRRYGRPRHHAGFVPGYILRPAPHYRGRPGYRSRPGYRRQSYNGGGRQQTAPRGTRTVNGRTVNGRTGLFPTYDRNPGDYGDSGD